MLAISCLVISNNFVSKDKLAYFVLTLLILWIYYFVKPFSGML